MATEDESLKTVKTVEVYKALRELVREEFGQFCPLREPAFSQLQVDVAELKTRHGRFNAVGALLLALVLAFGGVFFAWVGGVASDVNAMVARDASLRTLMESHLATHPDRSINQRLDRLEDRLERIELLLRGDPG